MTYNKEDLKTVCGRALRRGGDYCDLFFEDTTVCSLRLRDSSVCAANSNIDYGCGIRVLSGEKTGYAYTESTDMKSLLSAADAAAAIADSAQSVTEIPPVKVVGTGNLYPMKEDWRDARLDGFCSFLQKLDREIRGRDSRVTNVTLSLTWSISEILMFNSLGEMATDTRPVGSVRARVVFVKDGKSIENTASKSLRMGSEMINDSLCGEIADKVLKGIDERFEARRPKGGRMDVVMAAGASGILLHEAMGHAFEADFNRKGQSVFTDKMGKKVCSKPVNIVDDALLPFYRGSVNVDDELVPGQKTYMVTDGVLTSYLHDRISAGYYGVSPTGNGRRESFRFNPIPRMRSTYMENGTDGTLEDLIGGIKKGIFVDEFANGEVKIGEGDFTFYVKSGSLIENGRLTMPVKDVNIIGNGPEALMNITHVSSDLKVDTGTWTCGKGQSALVSCGMPSIIVKGLTIGGSDD